jgi:hypothetical protein
VFPAEILYGAYSNVRLSVGTALAPIPGTSTTVRSPGDLQVSALYNFNIQPAMARPISSGVPATVFSVSAPRACAAADVTLHSPPHAVGSRSTCAFDMPGSPNRPELLCSRLLVPLGRDVVRLRGQAVRAAKEKTNANNLAAAVLTAAWQLCVPANAQAPSPSPPSPGLVKPSPNIPEQKLDAAAAALAQVATIKQDFQQKIEQAAPSDKERIADEANDALSKAVTDRPHGRGVQFDHCRGTKRPRRSRKNPSASPSVRPIASQVKAVDIGWQDGSPGDKSSSRRSPEEEIAMRIKQARQEPQCEAQRRLGMVHLARRHT